MRLSHRNRSADPRDDWNQFLARLRQLSFCTVTTMLMKRKDLAAFIDKRGHVITNESPTEFGPRRAEFAKDEWLCAKAEYTYYCGFAGSVFFSKNSRSDRQVCFMPVSPSDHRFGMPKENDTIFGQIDEHDPQNRKFIWWDVASKQDQRFAGVLLGTVQFSQQNLEAKLTVRNEEGQADRTLYLLAMALRYHDAHFFRQNGPQGRNSSFCGRTGTPVVEWLEQEILDIAPDFCAKVRELI